MHKPPGPTHRPPQAPTSHPTTNNAARDATSLAEPSPRPSSLNIPARSSPSPSPAGMSSRQYKSPRQLTSPAGPRPPTSPLSPFHRSASSMSVERRSASPALARKTSAGSLRNGDVATAPKRRSSILQPVPSQPEEEVRMPLTAAGIAKDFFTKELELHEGHTNAGTVVFLHDSCYGHRFSRPKTTKSTLSLIVERPERILASVLGISTAYVRLGGRHAEGHRPPRPDAEPTADIPFRICKTSRSVPITSPVVTNVHGTKWMEELKEMCMAAEHKLATTGKELSRTADAAGEEKEQFHEGDLYLAPETLNALQGALGGVLDGVDAVFEGTSSGRGPSRAFVCIRPPGHHCSADFPSGFCWLNNVHVGIQHAALAHGLTHAAIIDFDLHHGDGSQAITWEHNARVLKMPKNTNASKKTHIGYFSLHDINSYPCEWGDVEKVQNASLCIEQAHGQSIWNVHLQPWKTEEEFWALYENRYLILLEKARAFLKHHTQQLRSAPNKPQPKAAIFISAGFDASEWESQGMQRHKVNVPTEFYARFTTDVTRLAEEEGTGVDGRVISVLEGGYSDRALTSGVLSHLSGLCHGQVQAPPKTNPVDGFDSTIERMANLNLAGSGEGAQTYQTAWWQPAALHALETLVYPIPPAPIKRPKQGPMPSYSSPTQSFTAKVVDPTKIRNMSAGSMRAPPSPPREPTPPPPEVEWTMAAHELSRLLIPQDRQTKSCRPEDLRETREKKERKSTGALPIEPSGRQLRSRKPKAGTFTEVNSDDDDAVSLRSASRTSRRKTIDVPQVVESADAQPPLPDRRSSVASSVGTTISSSRRSSIVPSTTADGGLPVQKTRTGANTRPETTQPKAEKKEAPVHARAVSSKSAGGSPTGPAVKENDVDQLTSGLKRISLKLPPKEEYEARERQKAAEAEKKKAAAAAKAGARKTPASRAPRATHAAKKSVAKPPATAPQADAVPNGTSSREEGQGSKLESGAFNSPPQTAKQEDVSTAQANSSPPPTEPHSTAKLFPPDSPSTPLVLTEDQLPQIELPTTLPPLHPVISPPHPDTPPPPPPAGAPEFVHYHYQYPRPGPPHAPPMPHGPGPIQWMPLNSDVAAKATEATQVNPPTPRSVEGDGGAPAKSEGDGDSRDGLETPAA